MRRLALLRPEPAASESAARATALGMTVLVEPLFELVRVRWQVPDTEQFDGVLMTSANAAMLGGRRLKRLTSLPVHAVGETTAAAARAEGFEVATVGSGGVDALLSTLPQGTSLLHLSGADRRTPRAHGNYVVPLTVYRSAERDPVEGLPGRLAGAVAAVHSRRAGERLASLVEERATVAVVALSDDCAVGAGDGWERVAVASEPRESALLALAAELCL